MLKKILLFVVALLVLLLIIGALLPSEFEVERSTIINTPVENVFEQVVDLNNYQKWNPWSEKEPEAKNTVSGQGRGLGSTWSWEGQIICKGSLSIIKLEEGKSIETKIEFFEPMQGVNYGFWQF